MRVLHNQYTNNIQGLISKQAVRRAAITEKHCDKKTPRPPQRVKTPQGLPYVTRNVKQTDKLCTNVCVCVGGGVVFSQLGLSLGKVRGYK